MEKYRTIEPHEYNRVGDDYVCKLCGWHRATEITYTSLDDKTHMMYGKRGTTTLYSELQSHTLDSYGQCTKCGFEDTSTTEFRTLIQGVDTQPSTYYKVPGKQFAPSHFCEAYSLMATSLVGDHIPNYKPNWISTYGSTSASELQTGTKIRNRDGHLVEFNIQMGSTGYYDAYNQPSHGDYVYIFLERMFTAEPDNFWWHVSDIERATMEIWFRDNKGLWTSWYTYQGAVVAHPINGRRALRFTNPCKSNSIQSCKDPLGDIHYDTAGIIFTIKGKCDWEMEQWD